MTDSSRKKDEVRLLADALFDGNCSGGDLARLEFLIMQDLGCLQTYVEQINFHSVVAQAARQLPPEQAALSVLKEFSHAIQIREKRAKRKWQVITGSVLASALLLVIALVTPVLFQGTPVGTIVNLSADLKSPNGLEELGNTVRAGETLSIAAGIMTLNLRHATVDVMGPAQFQFKSPELILLKSGAVVAKIRDEISGFTVRTPVADVVDLGTEFRVSHSPDEGTHVSVREGRVQASLLNRRGEVVQKLDLTDQRAAMFISPEKAAREVGFQPELFRAVDSSRAGILNIDGLLRTTTHPPVSFLPGDLPTRNHILIIPEAQRVQLGDQLSLNTTQGPVSLPAGTVVSSYLVHYDPPFDLSLAPRGAVTFSEKIAGVIADSEDLAMTDQLFAGTQQVFETQAFRGLEFGPDEDRVQISIDRHTVSFHFDMSPPHHLDEARIIVLHPF